MAISTVVNKRSFEAGFDTGNAGFVDVGLFLFAASGFDIQIIKSLAINHGNAQLFWLSCVKQHSFHFFSPCAQPMSACGCGHKMASQTIDSATVRRLIRPF